MRAKAVADGQQVEIPVLLINRTVGTQEDRQTGEWKDPVKDKAKPDRQIRQAMVKFDKDRNKVGKLSNPHCQEKPL